MVGGDRLSYDVDSSSPATDLLETKILFNSVISNAKDRAKFLSMALKDIFLRTPIQRLEYMKVALTYFTEDIMQ